jgi:hypothetical protein
VRAIQQTKTENNKALYPGVHPSKLSTYGKFRYMHLDTPYNHHNMFLGQLVHWKSISAIRLSVTAIFLFLECQLQPPACSVIMIMSRSSQKESKSTVPTPAVPRGCYLARTSQTPPRYAAYGPVPPFVPAIATTNSIIAGKTLLLSVPLNCDSRFTPQAHRDVHACRYLPDYFLQKLKCR